MDRRPGRYDGRYDGRRGARDPRERSPPPARGYSNSRDRHDGHRAEDRSRYGSERRESEAPSSRASSRYPNDRGQYGQPSRPSGQSAALPEPTVNREAGALIPVSEVKPTGTAGQAIRVHVNHFALLSLPTIRVFEYEIVMAVSPLPGKPAPTKISKDTKMMLFSMAKARGLWRDNFVFDGEGAGWSISELCPPSESRSTTLTLPGKQERGASITVRNKGALNVKGLVDYLTGGGGPIPANRDDLRSVTNALNAVYRHVAIERSVAEEPIYCVTPSAFFTRSREVSKTLPSTAGVLEAIRGFYQRISLAFGRLSLNVDVCTTAFYVPDNSMVNVAAAFTNTPPGPQLERLPPLAFEKMRGIYFCVRHLDKPDGKTFKFRVNNISPQGAEATTFEIEDPMTSTTSKTTVQQYFARKYHVHLQLPKLPLLVTRKGSFPMEVCWTAPGERYKEPLQGAETSDFIQFATSPAFIRRGHIDGNIRELKWHERAIPYSMGLAVQNQMLNLPARVLRAPVVEYGNRPAGDVSTGKWNLRGLKLKVACGFRAWGVLYFPQHSQRTAGDRELQNFCEAFQKAIFDLGISVPGKLPAFLKANPDGNIHEAVKDILQKVPNGFDGQNADLIVVLAHEKMHPGLYKAVKHACEVDFGVPCQYLLVDKCLNQKGQLQYLANVGMKVNAKLGGATCVVKEPLFDRPFMMLGADVTHPSPGELRRENPPPSVAALVGSWDRHGSQFTSVATAQDATHELIKDLRAMAEELLERFRSKNSRFPGAVIYWRDGISEGQIPALMSTEVQALKAALQKCGSCKLTVVNCVKRHHTRIFPRDRNEAADKLGNVRPCTVVESGAQGKDIFAVTQSALQGTCRPTRYQVLLDEQNLSADDFQRLVTNGCFNYARATRSVSLVSATYYADQVAERAKNHLGTVNGQLTHRDINNALKYTMWWQ